MVWVGKWYDGLTRSALGPLARTALGFLERALGFRARCARRVCVLVVSGGVKGSRPTVSRHALESLARSALESRALCARLVWRRFFFSVKGSS